MVAQLANKFKVHAIRLFGFLLGWIALHNVIIRGFLPVEFCTTPQSAHSYTYFGFGIGWWRHPENLGVPVSYPTRPKSPWKCLCAYKAAGVTAWLAANQKPLDSSDYSLELLGWMASGFTGTIRVLNLTSWRAFLGMCICCICTAVVFLLLLLHSYSMSHRSSKALQNLPAATAPLKG